ncbi:hypothetical protein PybrP1_010542, partial [[Pythium] brassicae (nom. inval.)]
MANYTNINTFQNLLPVHEAVYEKFHAVVCVVDAEARVDERIIGAVENVARTQVEILEPPDDVDAIVFAASHMLEDAKYEAAFELELHTDAVTAHMRFNPAATLALASSDPHQQSILKMLSSSCSTKAGRKRLAQMIARPCVDLAVLEHRHQLVAALIAVSVHGRASALWCAVVGLLSHFRAFEAHMEAFTATKIAARVKLPLALQDFERLQQWSSQVPTLLAQGGVAPLSGDEKCVEASYFAPLKELWRTHLIEQCETDIEILRRQTAGVLRLASERIKVVFDDDNAASLRVQRTSKASGVLFSTSELDRLSATWRALKFRHQEAEDALVSELTELLESDVGRVLAQVVERIADLDVLEIRLSRSDGKMFLLLAGGSAEANSCTLQTIGLVAVLNQIGCFVPCGSATLPVFDAICLRTGAHDDQLFGHSTFLTEMREMAKIFRFAT